MRRPKWRFYIWFAVTACLPVAATAQKAFTWEEVRERFEHTNPTLLAGFLNIEESRAQEVTAFLRPNPDISLSFDQFQPFNTNPYRPLAGVLNTVSVNYLHERQHKRELRKESAEKATGIATAQQADLDRTLVFNLRNAFVQTLQAKAVMAQARENLASYDKILEVSRTRKAAGDIAQMDLDRLELQRVQFESDLQTALVNLRTAKIQLLTLLNDRTPVDQFDVTGTFDFNDHPPALDEVRQTALDSRPDLKAAMETVDKARTDHRLAIANGSTDPTFSFDYGRNPPLIHYLGFSVSFPIRMFDKNQGEKARTEIDIQRSERARQATEAQVFSDVDSAYATLNSTLALLRPYRDKYLATASRVRETVSFAYQHGGAALLDFLQAEQEYRAVQVAYLNLIGSYLSAASQLDMAAGKEIIAP